MLPHRERHVGMPVSLAERLPVDLGVPARRRVAVPHVVEVNKGQACPLGLNQLDKQLEQALPYRGGKKASYKVVTGP